MVLVNQGTVAPLMKMYRRLNLKMMAKRGYHFVGERRLRSFESATQKTLDSIASRMRSFENIHLFVGAGILVVGSFIKKEITADLKENKKELNARMDLVTAELKENKKELNARMDLVTAELKETKKEITADLKENKDLLLALLKANQLD